MKKGILKLGLQCILLILLLASCKKEKVTPEAEEIDKAIALIHNNKPINDTLLKYRKESGIEFMSCYIRTRDNHKILSFDYTRKHEKIWPVNIDRPYKIENINGIDIFFITNGTPPDEYQITMDPKMKELVKKGYLSVDGSNGCTIRHYVQLVFCEKDDSNFRILSDHFLYQQEMKARKNKKPFHEEYFYPECD